MGETWKGLVAENKRKVETNKSYKSVGFVIAVTQNSGKIRGLIAYASTNLLRRASSVSFHIFCNSELIVQSTRNIKIIMFLGSKVRWVRRADNLTAICEPTVGSLSSQPYRPPWPVTGITLLYGDEVCFLWGTNWTVSAATSSQYLAVNCEPIV
jgi:hypothetical protein